VKGRKAKLTPQEADEIRAFYFDRLAKWSLLALARSYHVSTTTISNAVERKGAYADQGGKS
jgi:hypothetical protein